MIRRVLCAWCLLVLPVVSSADREAPRVNGQPHRLIEAAEQR